MACAPDAGRSTAAGPGHGRSSAPRGRVGARHARDLSRSVDPSPRSARARRGLVRAAPANGMSPPDPGRDFAAPETARPPERGRSSHLGDAQPARAVETLTTGDPSRHALSGCLEAAAGSAPNEQERGWKPPIWTCWARRLRGCRVPIDKPTSPVRWRPSGPRWSRLDRGTRSCPTERSSWQRSTRPSGRRNSSATRASRWT